MKREWNGSEMTRTLDSRQAIPKFECLDEDSTRRTPPRHGRAAVLALV